MADRNRAASAVISILVSHHARARKPCALVIFRRHRGPATPGSAGSTRPIGAQLQQDQTGGARQNQSGNGDFDM